MPRIKKSSQNVVLVNPPGNEQVPSLLEDDLPVNDALESLLNTLGDGSDGSKVMVYRESSKGITAKKEWLFQCSPAEFMDSGFEDLQREYGPGQYRVIVYGPDPSGNVSQVVIRSNRCYGIGAARGARVDAVAPSVDLQSAIAQALAPMIAQQNALIQALTGNQNGSRKEMLEEMRLMSEIMRGPQVAASSVAVTDPMMPFQNAVSILQTLKKLESEKTVAETVGDVDPSLGVIAKGLEVLGGMVENWRVSRSETLPQAAISSTLETVPENIAVIPQSNPISESDEMLGFKPYIAIALNSAKTNAPVDTFAELIYEHAPDEILATILENPEWFAKLSSMNSDVVNYRPWFEKLRACVVAIEREAQEETIEAVNKTQEDLTGSGKPVTDNG